MSLTIYVDRLPEQGIELRDGFSPEWLRNIPEFSEHEGTYIEGLIQVKARVTKDSNNIRVKGSLQTTLHTFCTRCGDDVQYPINSELYITLIPGEEVVTIQERELGRKELDEVYYQSNKIELDDYFREQVALDLPITILCKEDCKGLCPRCGVNLNQEKCSCFKNEGDPRLAVLRGLKIEKE